MLPVAHVSHQMEGRLRVRIPSMCRYTPYFQAAEKILSNCEGVHRVESNALSGGILVLHGTTLAQIERHARLNNLFDLIVAPPAGAPSVQISHGIEQVDQAVTALTGGHVDTRTWVFSGLLGAAVYQMLRGNGLPAGITLLHYALDALPRNGSPRGGRETRA
jgi:hypothetical protein